MDNAVVTSGNIFSRSDVLINIKMRYFKERKGGGLLAPGIIEVISVPTTNTINDILKSRNIEYRGIGWWGLDGVTIPRCDFDKPIVELLCISKQKDIQNIHYLVKAYKTGESFYDSVTDEFIGGGA